MSYELTWSEEPGYLHFRVQGENTPESLQGYLNEIHARCVEQGPAALLIEEDMQGPRLRLLDLYRVVSEAADRFSRVQSLRAVAYVDIHFDRAPENVQFGETVAFNRRVNVRTFRDVAAAAAWLHEAGAE